MRRAPLWCCSRRSKRRTATHCASTRRASTGWPRVTSCVARSSAPARRTPCGAGGSRRSRGFAGCGPSTCSIETPPPSRYFPPAMIVIPQKVRDGFGNLLDPLALRLIRLHVRPNLITTIGTLVIVASAVAFGLGRALATAVTVVQRVLYVARVARGPAAPRPPRVRETLPGHAPALQTRKGP